MGTCSVFGFSAGCLPLNLRVPLAILSLLAALVGLESPARAQVACPDNDGDGYAACDGICDQVGLQCGDCDDSNATVHPGASEMCDSLDNNCDGYIDEGLAEPCDTGTQFGISTCRTVPRSNSMVQPSCDYVVGPGQPITTICPLAATTSGTVCLLPGTYEMVPDCVINSSLVSTQGPDVTIVDGNLHDIRGYIQGLTIRGYASGAFLRGGGFAGNVILGALYTGRDGTHTEIVGNHVAGGVTCTFGCSVCDNVIESGGISFGGDVGALNEAVRNIIRNGSIIMPVKELVTFLNFENNDISSPSTGISIGQSLGGTWTRVVGNVIRGGALGIDIELETGAHNSVTIALNQIQGFSSVGVRIGFGALGDPVLIQGNLIKGATSADRLSPGPIGVLTGFSRPPESVGLPAGTVNILGNTFVNNATAIDLSCPNCSAETGNLGSNIIALNTVAGVAMHPGQPLIAVKNDVYGNGQNWTGIADPTGTDGNISQAPAFFDASADDFRLKPGSACIDQGQLYGLTTDLSGSPRSQDGNMDGVSIPDMGAYEMAPNRLPIANAGPPLTVECSSAAGATVTLDGSASSDPDSTPGTSDDIASYEWFEDPQGTLLGTGARLSVDLPLGVHTITLRVKDRIGVPATAKVAVTVADTVQPALTLEASPSMLWPPNGALVPVQIRWHVQDRCDPNPTVTLAQITSSESGDDPTAVGGGIVGDIAGAQIGLPDSEVLLRAYRLGTGPGRAYEITYVATDASGNAAPARVVVTVPHDRDKTRGRH